MKTTNVVVAIVYGAFLFLSFLYFIIAGSVIVDYLGIDKQLPSSLTLIVVAFISSLIFTALSSVPLIFTKREGLRKAILMLFSVSFAFYSVIVLFFLGFK